MLTCDSANWAVRRVYRALQKRTVVKYAFEHNVIDQGSGENMGLFVIYEKD